MGDKENALLLLEFDIPKEEAANYKKTALGIRTYDETVSRANYLIEVCDGKN